MRAQIRCVAGVAWGGLDLGKEIILVGFRLDVGLEAKKAPINLHQSLTASVNIRSIRAEAG